MASKLLSKAIAANNLLSRAAKGDICATFGIRICRGVEIVHIAKAAGYDSLFIDIEHTCMSLESASQLCITALSAGITPFVRVPHQCGTGFVQRTLDVGAMGVIIPHVSGVDDAKKVIEVTKYPPLGNRSLTAGFPHFEYSSPPTDILVKEMNESGSLCFLMVETLGALESIDEIAALPGCDVLLVGAQDLSMVIGTNPDWDHPKFWEALEAVGKAARRHGKIMGIAGLYHRPDILKRVINELGAKWVVGANDIGLLSSAGRSNSDSLRALQNK